jgi:hypothetical protein
MLLSAYQEGPLMSYELHDGIVYNTTYLIHHIRRFITRYNRHNSFVACTVQGPVLLEEYRALPLADPKASDFAIPSSALYTWGYTFLYNTGEGEYMFYIYKATNDSSAISAPGNCSTP